MSFNPSLVYLLDRVQGYSTNVMRLETQAQTTAKANSIITLDLPSNAIINTASLSLFCRAGTEVSGTDDGARLVPIDNFVERCEVSVGGIVLSAGANHTNVLHDAMVKLGQADCSAALGHPEMVRERSYVDNGGDGGAYLGTAANEDYTGHASHTFAIQHFSGFLDTCRPTLLDTSLIPDLRVRLYMAPNTVLSSAGDVNLQGVSRADATKSNKTIGTTTLGNVVVGGTPLIFTPLAETTGFGFVKDASSAQAAYELKDLFATIECSQMANQIYDQTISAMMSSQGFLEVPFLQYQSFQETFNGSTRFTCSTSSLNRVYVTFRDSGYDTIGAPVPVRGYKDRGGYVVGETNIVNIGIPAYDQGGVFDTNKEKYVSKYFNYSRPGTDDPRGTDFQHANQTFQLQLNGAYYPNFPAGYASIIDITQKSLRKPAYEAMKSMTFDQILGNYMIQCYRFCMPGDDLRSLSGIDTRSANLAGILKGANCGTSSTVNIWCELHSVLRIGPGRSCELLV